MTLRPSDVQSILRSDFVSFLAKCYATLHGGRLLNVTLPHRAMAHALQRCADRLDPHLIVTMPPRSLKSITISVAWVAWLLGHDPAVKVMCVSYAEDLAKRHSTDTRRIMESEWYRELFPDTVLAKATETVLETTRGGIRNATTVGGTVTGMGGDWIIVDDPSKAEDAFSKLALEKAIKFFTNTLYSRSNDPMGARILVTMQRIHEGDLAGFLSGLKGWTQLVLPATAPEDTLIPIGPAQTYDRKKGELLQPDRLTAEYLEDRREMLGAAAFQAQYQQAPLPEEGNIIKTDWIRSYASAESLEGGRTFISIDTAQKTEPSNDYSAFTIWRWIDDYHYLLEVIRERLDYPSLYARVVSLWAQHSPERILIENTGSGVGLIQDLGQNKPGIAVVPIKAKESKSVRVGTASALFENGQVFFPNSAPWLDQCLTEVLGFPLAKYDDIIDSIAQYLNWAKAQPGPVQFEYYFPGDEPFP